MDDELHPIQREMLRIEATFERQPADGLPVDECIAEMIAFSGDVNHELDPMIEAETRRALTHALEHYGSYGVLTPLAMLQVGFLQGVTFATAARNLSDAGR
jgi:hypothetical protein